MTTDITDHAEGIALEALTASIYFDEDPDEEEIEKLKGVNLVELLEKETDAAYWDMGRIKVICRALRIIKPPATIEFIIKRFGDLLVFAKEICLLMEDLAQDSPGCFDPIRDAVISAIVAPPASSIQLIRTWLLEIFCRGIIDISPSKLKKFDSLPSVFDKRQLLLIRGRGGDKNFFRKKKTAAHSYSTLELPYLVWGASCLPKDEYENWIDTVKGNFKKPLGSQYLKWAVKNRATLIDKLKHPTVELPE